MRREFGLGLRYIVVLVLPASVLFAVLAQPMLGVIVRHQFTAHDAVVTADTLQAFAISLVPFSVYLYAMRAFYALQDTRTPFVLNAFENGLNVVLAIVLFPHLGVQGLALAWSGAYFVAAVGAMLVLRRRIGGVPDAAAIRSAARRRRRAGNGRRRGSGRGRDRALVAGGCVAGDRGRGCRGRPGVRPGSPRAAFRRACLARGPGAAARRDPARRVTMGV